MSLTCKATEVPRPYSVLRLPSRGTISVLLLSDLIGFRVHFERSSMLCPREDCPACRSGRNTKYVGYTVVLSGEQRQLLRLTEAAARSVERQQLAYPGAVWMIEKKAARSTPQISELAVRDLKPGQAVNHREVLARVALLHSLGVIDPAQPLADLQEQIATSARLLLSRMLVH
jgi:hypothetical protein